MKIVKYIILVVFAYFFLSCVNEKKESNCMPGFVFLVYMGESDKPIYPLLLKTDKEDLSYHQYVGDGQEQYKKNGFIIDKDHIKNHNISSEEFLKLKNYIINNNTKKRNVIIDEGFNSLKVILLDQCDSIVYIIDKTNEDYLSSLKKSLITFDDGTLNSHLDYYQKILIRNLDERYKENKRIK